MLKRQTQYAEIILNKIECHEVSEVFRISPLPKKEPTKEVSDNGDWML